MEWIWFVLAVLTGLYAFGYHCALRFATGTWDYSCELHDSAMHLCLNAGAFPGCFRRIASGWGSFTIFSLIFLSEGRIAAALAIAAFMAILVGIHIYFNRFRPELNL